MERRLCVAECEKDKTQQRAKRSIDMMIHAKCAQKQRWGSHELDDPGLNSAELGEQQQKCELGTASTSKRTL